MIPDYTGKRFRFLNTNMYWEITRQTNYGVVVVIGGKRDDETEIDQEAQKPIEYSWDDIMIMALGVPCKG